jgi:hypothetical protein
MIIESCIVIGLLFLKDNHNCFKNFIDLYPISKETHESTD